MLVGATTTNAASTMRNSILEKDLAPSMFLKKFTCRHASFAKKAWEEKKSRMCCFRAASSRLKA